MIYLCAAYLAIWFLIFGYLFFLRRKQKELELRINASAYHPHPIPLPSGGREEREEVKEETP